MTAARRLYRFHLVLGGLGVAAIALGVQVAVGALTVTPSSAQAIAAACRRLVPAATGVDLLVVGLGALGVAAFLLGLRSLRRQLSASRRHLATVMTVPGTVEVAGTLCWLVADQKPRAYCAGYLRPRIYLSTGALDLLSCPELRAVIAHEAHHAKRRDPLRLLIARVLADALFFLPVLRRASDRYAALAELAADEAAVKAARGRSPLASALLALGGQGPGPAAIVGIAPERVDHLTGDARAGRWRLPASMLGGSVLGAAGLLVAALLAGQDGADATLNLPLVVVQSCMPVMGAASAVAALSALAALRRARRPREG